MDKEKNIEYIKHFSNISVKKICEELKVNRSNILNGTASAETIKKVKDELERRIKEL